MKRIRCLLLTLSILMVSTLVSAGEPTTQPMLRLNTEMHFATVRRISSDAAERFVLTCSDDKTAKLWDADDGTLHKTFRVPVDKGNDGMLYSCALSPDGRTAAVGGWSKAGYKGKGNHNIYIISTTTGEMIQRLSGLENVINDLEYHSDGTLAAALGGSSGIRIFRKSGNRYTLHHKDTNYGGDSYGLIFDHSGRLASVSYDGYVRLYDSRFKLIRKVKPDGGEKPFSVAFSSDGSKLAVGYGDLAKVKVLNGKTLKLLYQPDISGIGNRKAVRTLTFTPGGYLYGGGSHQKVIDDNWWRVIRRWNKEGRGSFIDFKAADNTIVDIKPLKDGSILMAGGQPDFGRYTASGDKIFYKRGETSNFRNSQFKYLTVNRGGSEISFKPNGLNAFTFSINERELKQSSRLFEKFRDQKGELRVTEWENTYSPKINGREADFLKKYEVCRCVDIADSGTLLFGSNWQVTALDSAGVKKWSTAAPGTTWAVNIARDGKTAVAAHSGGEIRWYRMRDGAVLLSLYVNPDGKRWILWSPDGYYDASPGADSLVGWHINNGSDHAAGFYPLSKFASKFYRPDVVANVIKYNDIDKALLYANRDTKKKAVVLDVKQMLPPEIVILSPESGSDFSSNRVKVRYKIKNPSGQEVTNIKVLVDGRPLGQRGLEISKQEGTGEIEVTVPAKDSTLALVAENRYAASEPASIALRWKGTEEFIIKPKLYVLAIGVSKYRDTSLTLEYAAKDARDFARVLQKQKGALYRDVSVKLLADEEATKGDILDGLDWILEETTQQDVAMVFLAGHGVNDAYGDYYYLSQNTNLKKLRRTAVAYNDIKTTVANLAGKALFFIDTCHSGNVMGKRRGALDTTGIINELSAAENGVVVFSSSTGRQYSLEDKAWGNGAFTKALVEGFSGKAAYRGNKITVNMLDLYISERVKELTKGKQTPTTVKPPSVPDFPVAMK
jgi:caspase domain-containing protein/WD40 domain-containing protein